MRRPGDEHDPKKRRKKVDLLGKVREMWYNVKVSRTERSL